MRLKAFFIAAILFAACHSIALCADFELDKVRNDYAMHYFKAEAHLRLAKYLVAHADPLTAFYISEIARRENFPAEEFDRAFRVVFRDDHFDNSAAAEERLRTESARLPDLKKTLSLADIYVSRAEWGKAEAELRKAMVMAPDSYEPVSVLAEVLNRTKREHDARTLEDSWTQRHPDSREAWLDRVGPAVDAGTANAEALCDEALKKFPQDAMFHFEHARLLQKKGDLPRASDEFRSAAGLDPQSAFIQGWTARFFLKAMKDEELALRYYLAAYFLDPNFYDSEYAEGRVRTIAYNRGQRRYALDLNAGMSKIDILSSSDPVVAGLAMTDVATNSWSDKTRDRLVALLSRDDPSLRYGAADILGKHADASFDPQLRLLLSSSDLRVRSAAAYVAGARWKSAVVPILEPWLTEPADLIRYDAISVLIEDGGEPGRIVLRKLRASGSMNDSRLRAILENLDRTKTPQ